MKLYVYGRKIEIMRSDEKWRVFLIGSEGKKRIADDIIIPSTIKQSELINYVADLCHEWASPNNNQVLEIK